MSSESMNNNNDDAESDEKFEKAVEEELEESLAEIDWDLVAAVKRNNASGIQHALRNGANVNRTRYGETPLYKACTLGYDPIVRILLDAGADPWWTNRFGWNAMFAAVEGEHLSTIERLLRHDEDLLEIEGRQGKTPLLVAICKRQFDIVHFLLDRGANALATNEDGLTTLLLACQENAGPEIVRRLLAADVPVEARDMEERTALYHAASCCNTAVVRELIVAHNANMFAVDQNGKTPFNWTARHDEIRAALMECYSNKLTQEHGRLALHALLADTEYSFVLALQIRLPLGMLTLQHFLALLSTVDTELIRNRDESGQLPIHMACQSMAPVEVLALIVQHDTATLQMADHKGELPIHSLCSSGMPVEHANVRFLVEHGGVNTLAARNQEGALPLHLLCGSTIRSLRTVQYMIQSFSEALAVRTNAGQYPFMIAACKSSTASLSVVYELVRTNPGVATPR